MRMAMDVIAAPPAVAENLLPVEVEVRFTVVPPAVAVTGLP